MIDLGCYDRRWATARLWWYRAPRSISSSKPSTRYGTWAWRVGRWRDSHGGCTGMRGRGLQFAQRQYVDSRSSLRTYIHGVAATEANDARWPDSRGLLYGVARARRLRTRESHDQREAAGEPFEQDRRCEQRSRPTGAWNPVNKVADEKRATEEHVGAVAMVGATTRSLSRMSATMNSSTSALFG